MSDKESKSKESQNIDSQDSESQDSESPSTSRFQTASTPLFSDCVFSDCGSVAESFNQVASKKRMVNPQAETSLLDGSEGIGPYRLLEKIGEGGMGLVWRAEQTEPVRRIVAVKIIKPRFLSQETVNRFQLERKTLALMNHPNIARIIDAGQNEDGLPYFVMDWVEGQTITEYCDTHCLTIDQRLSLFIQVCGAVQHAHQKGIIHRDLKPSNILVAEIDGTPVPKVIDFGLAKETESSVDSNSTDLTRLGQVLGTLKYMSPEQAGLNRDDVDTRSDIYSLGVVLYELLTSRTPIDNAMLKNESVFNLLQIIRDGETVRPSSQLSASDHKSTAMVTHQRGTDVSHLQRILVGDLDWITMKALEKHRGRRYESATALAMDLQRYLAGAPVLARPPSFFYVTRKFVSKHRISVGIAVLLLVSLVAGITATNLAVLQAIKSERLAEKRLDEKKVARKEALSAQYDQAELRKLETKYRNEISTLKQHRSNLNQLASMMASSLSASKSEPTWALRDRALGNNLKVSLARLKDKSFGQPIENVRLRLRLAGMLRQYGEKQLARELLLDALQESTKEWGENSSLALSAESHLLLYQVFDGQETNKAVRRLEEILEYNRNRSNAWVADWIIDMNNLASAYQSAGQIEEEVQLRKEIVETYGDNGYFSAAEVEEAKFKYALCLERQGKLVESIEVYRELLESYVDDPPENTEARLAYQANLGLLLLQTNQLEAGVKLLEIVAAESESNRFDSALKELEAARAKLAGDKQRRTKLEVAD